MSLAYFDDTATLYIKCGENTVRRTVDMTKADCVRGADKDTAVIYIPIYNLRDIKFVDPGAWDEEDPPSGFTLRPGDGFTYRNTGRRGSSATSESPLFTVKTVEINTRGSRRMRHIKAYGEHEID